MNLKPKPYQFFDQNPKKTKKQTTTNHSRSLSAKSDLTKGSTRNKIVEGQSNNKQACLPLTKK